MQKYRLAKEIPLKGRTWFGREAKLTLAPHWTADDNWFFGGPKLGVPITLDMLHVFPGLMTSRTITLEARGRRFHEFEHVGWLHALGLRGVRIYLEGSNWPPYMCAGELFERVFPWLEPCGELQPYYPEISNGGGKFESLVANIPRWIDFNPYSLGLSIEALVRYPDFDISGRDTLSLSNNAKLQRDTLRVIATSRSLGRPAALRILTRGAKLFGWPHENKLLWLADVANGEVREQRAFFQELARHQILDTLTPLSFIPSEGEYLHCRVVLHCCNHSLALDAAKEMVRRRTLASAAAEVA